MATYSFIDVYATLVDAATGASFQVGSRSGIAEEGITVVQMNNISNIQVGADGTTMTSLLASYAGRCTIRLLKTSPLNAALMQLTESLRQSGATWGRITISLTNIATGDEVVMQQCSLEKIPDNNYDKIGRMLEWTFLVSDVRQVLGITA